MAHPRMSGDEIHRRGQALYDERIRAIVETPENIGKLVAIDVETGDYHIADDGISATQPLLAKRPGAALYGVRIGYDAVYSLGGTLQRTSPA